MPTKRRVRPVRPTKRTSQKETCQLINMTNADLLRYTQKEGTELKILCELLQPNIVQICTVYNLINQDLTSIISSRYQKFEIHPFGSTVSGLAFKG